MPVITEEGFDILQESTIQEDSTVAPNAENQREEKSGGEEKKKSELETETEPSPLPLVSAKGDSDNFGPDVDNEEEDDDEDLDETLAERLWALTEMFPDSVRDLATNAMDMSQALVKGSYSFTCNAAWVVASSATILVLPVMFELERAQMEQQQLQQQRQILLGPNAAASGAGGMMPAMPGPPR